jgi:RNA polymerase sigma factor (sigma-70 family)
MATGHLGGVLQHLRRVRETYALNEASDGQLLERFARGREEAAFAALLRRHGAMVLSVSERVLHQRQDAEDVFQATFLLLARKASSIRKRESVASWLHGVAHRIALKTRTRLMIRRRHEKKAADRIPPAVRAEAWQEVQAALDAALSELPERYRAPLVLCCLEGKSLAEAARLLGRPLATVGTQLARGRKLLRERLTQHGLTVSVTGMVSLLLANTASSATPPALTQATVAAALALQAGRKAAAVCSSRVAELVERELHTIVLSNFKWGLVSLVAACGIAICIAQGGLAGGHPTEEAKAPKADTKPQAVNANAVAFSGRVVDTEGKPIEGAKVYYYFVTRDEVPTPVRARTDADGRFSFALSPNDVPLSPGFSETSPFKTGFIVVKADGFTFGWQSSRQQTTDLAIKLARDEMPLEGRILDLQGKPIAGVRVSVLAAATSDKGSLDDFLQAMKGRNGFYMAVYQQLPNWLSNSLVGSRGRVSLLPGTETGKDGRFRIHGFAREQLVQLRLEGPTIERKDFFVLMRAKPAGAVDQFTPNLHGASEMAYGLPEHALVRWNAFDFAAGPGQVIVGTVRDAETKAPLPGAIVESYVLAGTNTAQNTIYHTVADAQGRYRFTGLPRGKGTRIRIVPPKNQPYIPLVKNAPEKEPLVEATVDADLPRGVFVDITAKDRKTGQPVRGSISYFTFPDNPDPKAPFLRGPYADSYDNFMPIRNDGTFRFVAAPRKAIVAIRTDWNKYPIAREAPTIQLPSGLSSSNFAAFATINPKLGDEAVKIDFVLDAGGVVKGRVLGPDGQPLADVLASGLRHDWYIDADWPPLSKTGEFTAIGLDPEHPRLVCFASRDKKFAGSVILQGDEKEPVTVQLERSATVSGRPLDTDGQPIKNVTLWFTQVPPLKSNQRRAMDVGIHVVARIPGENPDPHTDENGRFKVEGLVPGLKYNLAWMDTRGGFDKDHFQWKGLVFSNLVLKPGEMKDLGDVKLQPFPK